VKTLLRPARIRRFQRTALVLLLLGTTLNYVDRSTLAVANPLVRQDLSFSLSEMGKHSPSTAAGRFAPDRSVNADSQAACF